MKKLMRIIFIFSLFTSQVSKAQESVAGPFKEKMATVMFCSLGGAVLGLSTLSFYGEPQKHIGNIYSGVALGFIAGLVYVTYDSANKYSWFDEVKENEERLLTKYSPTPQLPPVYIYQF